MTARETALRLRERALLPIGSLAGAILFLLPALADFGRRLRDPYDSQMVAWALAWCRSALLSPAHLFNANVFAPVRGALAFSEPLLGYVLLSLPFAPFGPVAAYDGALLLGLAITPLALALLAREAGASRPAALVGALVAAFSANTVAHLPHLAFSAWGAVALPIAGWLRHRRGERGGALLCGASLGLLGWFSLQLFAFALVALVLLLLADLLAAGPRFGDRELAGGAIALGIALLVVAPLALTLSRVHARERFARSEAEVDAYSADLRSWVSVGPDSTGEPFAPRTGDSERSLFPGFVALGLAATGIFGALPVGTEHRLSRRGVASLLVAIGVVGSLGSHGPLFRVLREAVPQLFVGIRAAARFSFVAGAGLALLAALGADRLLAAAGKRRVVAALAILAAAAFELRADTSFRAVPETPAPAAGPAPILHLPFFASPQDVRYMSASTSGFEPLVNGNSSHVPARHAELAVRLATAPSGVSAAELAAWPVRTLVLHDHLFLRRTAPERRLATFEWLDRLRAEGAFVPLALRPHADAVDLVFGAGASDPAAAALFASWLDDAREGRSTPLRAGGATVAAFDPPEGAVIHGWARLPEGTLVIDAVVLDGVPLPASTVTREPRPGLVLDLPHLFPKGDSADAGFRIALPRLAPGEHELSLTLRLPDRSTAAISRRFAVSGSPSPPGSAAASRPDLPALRNGPPASRS